MILLISAYAFLAKLIAAHTALVVSLGIAAVVSMREELPAPFNRIAVFVWFYGWLHDTLKTFVSLKAGVSKPEEKK